MTGSPARTGRLGTAASLALAALVGCSHPALGPPRPLLPIPHRAAIREVRIDRLRVFATAWHGHPTDGERPLRLLADAHVPALPALAIVRSIVRSDPRLGAVDALVLATAALDDARARGLDPAFFAATILQESGFAPDVVSPAGAVGIGQFTLETADRYGVDPFDPIDALRGSATLLAHYVDGYRGVYPDPYAAALAAYNAGPGTVAYYRGVPPYAETRGYVADIVDRWSRIVRDETGVAQPPS